MSKFHKSLKAAKPAFDISSNADFPTLSFNKTNTNNPIWNCDKINTISEKAKRYINGDIFEGEYDERGLPCFGKFTFSDGKIYEGPIRESWPEDYIENDYDDNDSQTVCDDENFEDEYFSDEWYEDEYREPPPPPNNYGKMTFADGSEFWGVFCFQNRTNWS